MNHSKFSIADIFTIVAALVFGFFCYLSFNFKFLGDTVKSVICAVVIAVVLGLLALLPKWMKSTDHNFKTHFILEWVFMLFFALAAVVAIFPFSHFFSVSSKDNKQKIQTSIETDIRQAEELYDNYEEYVNNRMSLFENEIRTAVVNRSSNMSEYSKYGLKSDPNVSDQKQMEHKINVLRNQLYPSNYEETKKVHNTWLRDSKTKVSRWNPIGVVNVVGHVQSEITSWVDELVKYSTYRAKGETAEDFSSPVAFSNVNEILSTKYSPTLVSVLLALGLYTIMLLSYFITRRHTRFPGVKLLFGGEHQRVPGEL